MAYQEKMIPEREYTPFIHRICWSAVFAGAIAGVGLAFLLHLYGIAISLSAYSSTPQGAETIAWGGFLGMLLGVIAATGAAGFLAGYLGRFHYHPIHGGVIYGFLTWSLTLFLSAAIAGPMSDYLANYADSLAHPTAVTASNDTGSTASANTANRPVVETTNSNSVADRGAVKVNPTDLAWGGWVVFALFFIGAISSCIGACFGIKCKRDAIIESVS